MTILPSRRTVVLPRRTAWQIPVAWLALQFGLAAFPTAAGEIPRAPLQSIWATRHLPAPEVAQHPPVHFRGIVTTRSGWSFSFFLQDATGAISIDPAGANPPVTAGDLVDVIGYATVGLFAPTATATHVTILGKARLPDTPLLELRQALTGRWDSSRIAMRGIVHSAERRQIWGRQVLYLQVDTGNGSFAVHVLNAAGSAQQLIDAEVLVRGVCGTQFNSLGQLVGIRMFVPSLDDVVVEKPGVPYPFALRPAALDHLLLFEGAESTGHRIRVQGTVTYAALNHRLFIQNNGKDLEINLRQSASLPPGTQVDVVGFPSARPFSPLLDDAVLRTAGKAAAPVPVAVEPQAVFVDRHGFPATPYQGSLVTIKGQLIEPVGTTLRTNLRFRQGNIVFDAELPPEQFSSPAILALQSGSWLAITGICVVDPQRSPEFPQIHLLLRSPQDLHVLRSAPWWNLEHTSWVLGSCALLVVLTGAAILSLRQRVAHQVAVIHRKEDHLRHALAELQDANDLLEARVEQRTEQLESINACLLRANDALQRSEARYRALLDQSPIVIHIFDPEGNRLAVNSASSVLFGRCSDELLNYNVLQDAQLAGNDAREALLKAFAGETSRTAPIRHRSAAGDDVWIEVIAYPVKDASEKVAEVVLLIHDVSQRQAALQALQKSEADFRRIADSLPQLVWTAQPTGHLDYYNERWYHFTGFPRHLQGDESWVPVMHPEDLPLWRDRWYVSVASGQHYELEYRLWDRHKHEYRWYLGLALPIRGADGRITKWFGTCSDIHESKTAKDTLESEVVLRTTELHKSLREKTVLLKELHHRVKNNLQIISSLLRMQANALHEPAARAALQDSRRRVLSMALIHERIYENEETTKIDFADYARNLAGEILHSLGTPANHVHCSVLGSHVLLDLDQAIPCGLILNELVTNTIQHAYPGNRNGALRIALQETEYGTVDLCVDDDGIGLPPSLNWQTGSSLGLPLVDLLCRQLGGVRRWQSDSSRTHFGVQFAKQKRDATRV